VKNEIVQLVLTILALVLGCAAEELLPKVSGVGFPVQMAATVFYASKRRVSVSVGFAIAAGAAEDAISGLPPATSVSFFLAVVALARWSEFPNGALVMAYPLYQGWLRLWSGVAYGSFFNRALVAIPFGIATAVATWAVLSLAERSAAIDES
jgi:hypothetical protein